MSRHPASTRAACAAIALIAALVLVACGSSSSGPAETSRDLAKYAWATGDEGTVLATTDGGAHWVTQPSGTSYGLPDVAFADPMRGWAVGGTDGHGHLPPVELVLSTVDGGAHWSQQTIGQPGGSLYAVACTDASHIWVGGSGPGHERAAVIHASSDGGAHWTQQYLAASGGWGNSVWGLAFADSNHGWAVTGSGHVLGTSDGGTHWALQTSAPAGAQFDGVACADARHCWAVGLGNGHFRLLLATTDGGASWHAASVPRGINTTEAVWSDDADHLYLGGVGSEDPVARNFFASTDGGANWRAASVAGPCDVSAITGSGSGYLWAVNVDTVAASTDGGATWVTRLQRPDSYIWGIACPRAAGNL